MKKDTYKTKTRYVHLLIQHSEIFAVVQRMTALSINGFIHPS